MYKSTEQELEELLTKAEQGLTAAICALAKGSPAYRAVLEALEPIRAKLGVEPKWLDPNPDYLKNKNK